MTATSSSQPVALITGASTGVGLHAALRFAQAGFVTVATMRDLSKGADLQAMAKAAGVDIKLRQLDVSVAESIAAGVKGVLDEFGKIDVLLNNAGAGFLGSVEQTSDAQLRSVMEVNFFGVWNMTKAVLPAMRECGSGRIISVSSVGGLLGQPFNEAYCAAKFAVEGMMEGLAPLARRMGIHVSLIEPGPINTDFVKNVRANSTSLTEGLAAPYDRMLASYMGASADVFAKYGQTGDEIAQNILAVAQSDKPQFRNVTSDFAKMIVKPKVVDMTGDSIVELFSARLG
jgi:NAD(P)-dependent dehydrogenase (short-subunit alcohol dehydrogenase family)